MGYPNNDYSIFPTAQTNQGLRLNSAIAGFGQMPQTQLPANFGQMAPVDYSFGQQGAMPVAGMGGGQGLQMRGAGGYGSMGNWGAGAGAGNSLGSGFGMNMPTFALGLQGLNSLGSLYMGAKSLSLANKQFASAEKFANTNLANQTHAYNDTLAKQINRIGSKEGTSREQLDAEIARRKLPAYNG